MNYNHSKIVEENMQEEVVSVNEIEPHVAKVTTHIGTYVTKYSNWDYASVKAEPYIIKALSNSYEIPVPTVYYESTQSLPPFYIMEHIEGTSPSHAQYLSINKLLEYSEVLGKHLGVIQQMSFETPGQLVYTMDKGISPDDSTLRSTIDKFKKQAERNYQFKLNVDSLSIPSSNEYAMCPIDFHCKNLLIKDGELRGIVDFERVYSGPRRWGYENTLYMLQLTRSKPVAKEVRKKFQSGYLEVQDLPKYHPVFELAAVLREMRAAHVWWENTQKHQRRLLNRLDELKMKV